MSRQRRPSLSMTMALFRLMAYAAELAGVSRCAWVADAIREKLERDRVPGPPAGWEPEHRSGRRSRAEIEAANRKHIRTHFTF